MNSNYKKKSIIRVSIIILIVTIVVMTSIPYTLFSIITSIFISINAIVFFVYRAKLAILIGLAIMLTHYQSISYAEINSKISITISEKIWAPLCLVSVLIFIYYWILTKRKNKRKG